MLICTSNMEDLEGLDVKASEESHLLHYQHHLKQQPAEFLVFHPVLTMPNPI